MINNTFFLEAPGQGVESQQQSSGKLALWERLIFSAW